MEKLIIIIIASTIISTLLIGISIAFFLFSSKVQGECMAIEDKILIVKMQNNKNEIELKKIQHERELLSKSR